MAGLMDIGKSGLQSYREALSVTGQNIANINTDGYKRREASLAEVTGSSGGITALSSQQGLGVRVEEIRRSFDEFLLNKARNATSYAANAESFLETISQLEDILLPGESNIGEAIGRFMETLQEVAANPNLLAPRIVALESGKSLTNSFHQTSALIGELQEGINTQSNQALSEINLLTANLANVNRNIASSGGKAQNALLDNRDAIIDRISEYVEVVVTLENTGAATLRLGTSENGPVLVKADKSTRLSASPVNNEMNFFVSQGAELIRTSQVSNGKLRGLADAYKSASDAMASIDHLAYKLIRDINSIHEEGIDLEGQRGGAMFHDVAFDAIPGVSNRGSGTAEVNVGDITAIVDEQIRFAFDGTENLWRAYNIENTEIASGSSSITLPGMKISFAGEPVAGDEMMLSPSKGAAGIIQFALTRPEQIAAASPFLISADPGNASSADIEITRTAVTPTPSTLPPIQEVISNSHSATASSQFMRDGAVAIIPANTDTIDLISLIQQSSAKFGIPETSLSLMNTLSLEISDGVNLPKTYTFDLAGYAEDVNQQSSGGEPFTWYDAAQVADLMNIGALTATNGVDLDGDGNPARFSLNDLGGYASGKDGNVSISLKKDSVESGQMTFGNAPGIEAVVTSRVDSASDIQIFTREGRHLAGVQYNGIEDLISAENGFNSSAEYRDDYLNLSGDDGYMGLNLIYDDNVAQNLIQVSSTTTGNTINFDRLNNIDTPEKSVDGRKASAGQFDYQLSVGSFSVSLSEANVDGDSAEDIAAAALRAIRAHAPVASMTAVQSMVKSESFALTADERTDLDTDNSLKITRAGVEYFLSEDNGSYSITGGRASSLTLSFDPNGGSSGTVASTYVDLPDDGDAVTIAFEGEQYQLVMKNAEVVVSGGEEGRILASFNADHKLVISSNQGSLNRELITVVGDDVVAGNALMAQRFGLTAGSSTASTVFTSADITVAKTVEQSQAGDRTPDINTHPNQFTTLDVTMVQIGDGSNVEIQEFTGLTAGILSSLEGNRLAISVGGISFEKRFATAPADLPALANDLNTAGSGAGLEAEFALNGAGDAVILTFDDPGAQGLGSATRIEDLPEIQTVSGFAAEDIEALANNRLEISLGQSNLVVSFTNAPSGLEALVQILNDEAATQGFDARFTSGPDTLIMTWAHLGDLSSATVNLIETYDLPDFDITRSDSQLIVEKRDDYPYDEITITSSATSNAGQRLTLSGLPEEELIIFLTGSDDGNGARARTLSAVYDMHPADALLPDQDITIRVMDAATGKIEFFDSATNTSIASRYLDENGEAAGLDYAVRMVGEVADSDAFHISVNSDGVFDNRNLLDLIGLQNSRTGEGNFQKIFSGLIAEVGAEIESNRLNAEAATALKDASLEAEAMYSGVNLDTEASKLIEYQQAYQASARILQTARELFNTLMDTI